MRVYPSIEAFEPIEHAIVTTGTFDGVHIGHRKIIHYLKKVAEKNKGETVLLTFFPHPRMVLHPDSEIKLIDSQQEKIQLLETAGIDHLIIHPFTKAFSRMSSLHFVRDVLVNQLKVKRLIVGYDHFFGRNREGSFADLKEYGALYDFEVEEIPAQYMESVAVSSTKIRKALQEGDIRTANKYLTREFQITGEVVKGAGRGKTIDFPTANINIKEDYKLTPVDGVYAVQANIEGEWFNGMMNIGLRPTFDGKERSFEVHLFDFDGDLYGETIGIRFIEKMRDERTFASAEDLKEQLGRDAINARKIFGML